MWTLYLHNVITCFFFCDLARFWVRNVIEFLQVGDITWLLLVLYSEHTGIENWVCADSITGYILTLMCTVEGISIQCCHEAHWTFSWEGSHCIHGQLLLITRIISQPTCQENYCSGTVRTNWKHFPAQLKPVRGEPIRPRGATTFAFHKQLTMVWWSDSKDVYTKSMLFADSLTTVSG